MANDAFQTFFEQFQKVVWLKVSKNAGAIPLSSPLLYISPSLSFLQKHPIIPQFKCI